MTEFVASYGAFAAGRLLPRLRYLAMDAAEGQSIIKNDNIDSMEWPLPTRVRLRRPPHCPTPLLIRRSDNKTNAKIRFRL